MYTDFKWLKSVYIYGSYRKIETGVSLFGLLCIWNDLPSDISSSSSLLTFKQWLQCTYSDRSYPRLPFNRSSPLWSLK